MSAASPNNTNNNPTQFNPNIFWGGGSSTHPPPTRVNPRGLKFCLPPHLTTTQHNLTLLFSGGGVINPSPPTRVNPINIFFWQAQSRSLPIQSKLGLIIIVRPPSHPDKFFGACKGTEILYVISPKESKNYPTKF